MVRVLNCNRIGNDVDEGELDAELAALEDEWDAEDTADASPAWLQPAMPSAMPLPAAGELPAAAPNGVDEFGLPVAPTMGRTAALS